MPPRFPFPLPNGWFRVAFADELRRHAGEQLARNVRGLMAGLPVWYQAFGERMIGGENYISPPHLARGLFAALAGCGGSAPE